jgi:(p)ppGpp synthase/HD superfamily hydrolase
VKRTPSILPPSRWELMVDRVDRTSEVSGVDGWGRDLVRRAIETAMVPRLAVLDDDHHPDYLHPGRTTVILLDDVGLDDPVALAAAALLDTRRGDLEVPDRVVTDRVNPDVTAFRDSVPRSGSATLLEDLLASEHEAVLVALVERLDQVRHAHLWGDLGEARAAHEEASEVYLKMAERTHTLLATRYAHWGRAFASRHLA